MLLLVNGNSEGFYRVLHSEDLLAEILEKGHQLTILQKGRLIDDYVAFFLAGRISEEQLRRVFREADLKRCSEGRGGRRLRQRAILLQLLQWSHGSSHAEQAKASLLLGATLAGEAGGDAGAGLRPL